MQKKTFLVLTMLSVLFTTACKKDEAPTDSMANCQPVVWQLTAGQTIPVGTVTVTNDADTLYVTYALDYPGACFGSLHLWADQDFSTLPVNNEDILIPGQFPYSIDATGLTSYTFKVPISDFSGECGDDIFVVPHAEVDLDCDPVTNNTETGFGGDVEGGGVRWWFYGQYYICCVSSNGNCVTETGFGGNSAGAGSAWWYAFDTQGQSCQNIFAGQQLLPNSMICYDAITDILTITLGDPGWSLATVPESVKVEGYDVLPNNRPAAGQFTLYKGTSLTVPGNNSRYYVVHLDLEYCE